MARQGQTKPASKPASESAQVPPIVHEVLSSPGQPLDPKTRSLMEPRFGHDFSQVRVHSDAKASESAQAVNALAYTVGQNVVFGAGQYTPSTAKGSHLLAHELTHVVQQHSAAPDGAAARAKLTVSQPQDADELEAERVAESVVQGKPLGARQPHPVSARGLQRRSIFAEIAGLFKGDSFPEQDLQDYLTKLDQMGKIEDYTDSDNKARSIVNAWKLGGSPYVLTAQRKALLIQEMQSGFTGDDDELAILELLERSYTFELSYIFGAGGVKAKDLNSDFHGEEWDQLQDFYQRRFTGGMAAVQQGRLQPTGYPLPLGAAMVTPSNPIPDIPLAGDMNWNVPCVLGILCTQDRAVVNQLPNLTIKMIDRIDVTAWSYESKHWVSEVVHPSGLNQATQKLVGLLKDRPCDAATETLIHEVRHQNQPESWQQFQKEKDAYTYTEQQTIAHGFQEYRRPSKSLRQKDPVTGEITPNVTAIEKMVQEKYGGATDVAGEQIVGRKEPNQTEIERPDGSRYFRPAQDGDRYLEEPPKLVNEKVIPAAAWKCPDPKK
jgi:hypothetical protein